MEKFITVKRKNLENYVFETGKLLCLKKEAYGEDIVAWVPSMGKIGVVVNAPQELVKGTFSASRVYDFFSETFYGQVMFAFGDKAVVKLIIEDNKPELKLVDFEKLRQRAQ